MFVSEQQFSRLFNMATRSGSNSCVCFFFLHVLFMVTFPGILLFDFSKCVSMWYATQCNVKTHQNKWISILGEKIMFDKLLLIYAHKWTKKTYTLTYMWNSFFWYETYFHFNRTDSFFLSGWMSLIFMSATKLCSLVSFAYRAHTDLHLFLDLLEVIGCIFSNWQPVHTIFIQINKMNINIFD